MAESIIYVPVAPSLRDFSGPIVREGQRAASLASRQMTSTFETGGANAGRAGGRGISAGLSSANGSIDSVNARMGRLPAQMGSAGQAAGAQAAAGINSGLASVDYQSSGSSIGSKIGGGLVTALKGTLKAGGIAAAIFGGAALKSGLDRLTTIEDATNSLKTIMGDANAAGELMGEIKKTVTGTPFNLDQFAEAGKNLVAMNVPAAKVPGYLTAIGEAAAASGKGAEGVQMLTDTFGKMAAQGQVSLDQVWSISGAGVPALQILANHFGTTTDGMKKMISEGAVPAGEAMDALTKGVMEGSDGMAGATRSYAGTMEGLRQTFTGAFGGMKAAIARFGAAFLGPWMPLITKTFGGVTSGLDTMAPRIQAFSERLANSQGVKNFAESLKNLPAALTRVKDGIGGVFAILKDGDFQGASKTFGFEEDSKFVDVLFRIREGVTGLTTAMRDGKPLVDTFKSAAEGGGEAGASALSKFGGALGGIGGGTLAILTESTNALGRAMGFLADHSELVVPVILALAAAYATGQAAQTGYQIAMIARTPAVYAQVAATWAQSSAMAAHTAALNANTAAMGGQLPVQQAGTLARMRSAIASGAQTAATWVGVTAIRAHTFATSGNVLATLRSTAATIASTVASKVARGAVLAWSAAQWLLNAAMTANPIGLIVAAIAALVAGFVIAYKNSETFRNIVQSVWEWVKKAADVVGGALVSAFNWVKDAIQPVIGFIQKYWQYLLFALGPMGMLIGVIVQIVKHFDMVKAVFATVWGVVKPILMGFVTALKILAAIVATVILGTVFIAWNLIKISVKAMWVVIRPIFDLFMATIRAIGSVAMWLYQNAIVPAFNGIKAAIGLWWTAAKMYFNAVKYVIMDVLVPAVMWLWHNVIEPAFKAIGAAIAFAWNSIIKPTFDALKIAVAAVGTAFQWVWNSVIKPAWDALGAGISFVWNSIIRPAWDALKAALGAIGDFFGWVWNTVIKPAWEGLGAGISAVINNVVKPAFDGIKTALQTVGDFFGTIVDGIKGTWDKLKGYVAAPINFVIETVWNEGLLKAWNKVAGFLPGLKTMDKLDPVKFAEGGPVPMGRGAQRGRDSVHALMMPDEHVWDVADVRNAGGHGAMYRMRGMVESGRPFTWTPSGVAPAGHGVDPMLRFKDGGSVEAGTKLEPSAGESGLQPIAVLAKRLIHKIWPKITDIGGYRQDAYPEHPSGRALDIMIGNDMPMGDAVSSWTLANDKVMPLQHNLWRQTVWTPDGGKNPMEDRGSPTQNHMDHVHAWFKDKAINPNIVPEGLVGADGLTSADKLNVLKKKIKEILDKALDPIKNGISKVIGDPPPEWLAVPGKVLTQSKDAAVDKLFDFAGGLGEMLGAAYDKAKDVATTIANVVKNPVGAITGLFRDQGGYIPAGMSVVRNETGRPEAVLNWKQLEEVRKLMEATGQAAGQGFLDDTLDFFGFKKLYDAIAGAVAPKDQANQGADAAAAGTQNAPESATSGAGSDSYTDPTYGDGSTIESTEVPLETKMPDLSHTYDPAGGAEQWRDMAKEAMKRVGFDYNNKAQIDAMVSQIQSESGGDPNIAQQISDVNGTGDQAGVGLLQVIPGTFAANRDPSLPDDRRDPMANMVAALRYYKGKYGMDLTTQWGHGHGYDAGGWLPPTPGGFGTFFNHTGSPEAVLTSAQWSYFDDLLEALPSASTFKAVANVPATLRSMVPPEDEQTGGRTAGGPLVVIENQWTYDPDEAAQKTGREVRRASRSDSLVGGW